MTAQPRLEARIDRGAAEAVGGDEHGVPASGPAERRRRALHVGAPLGGRRIVGGGDRALLGAEGLGRVAPRRVDVFGIDAARRRHRVGDGVEHARTLLTMWAMVSGPDVAGRAVADAVGRRELRCRGVRALAVHVVAETQQGDAVVLGLHDEVGGVAVACEQVAARRPAGRARTPSSPFSSVIRGKASCGSRTSNALAGHQPSSCVGRNAQLARRGRSPGSSGALRQRGTEARRNRLAFGALARLRAGGRRGPAQARLGHRAESLVAHGLGRDRRARCCRAPR